MSTSYPFRKFHIIFSAVIIAAGLFPTFAAPSYVSPDLKSANLSQIASDATARYAEQKAEGVVYALLNGFPIKGVDSEGRGFEIQGVINGVPQYNVTLNLNAARTIGVDKVWPGGSTGASVSGSGMTIGEWDEASPRLSHVEYTGRVTQRDGVTQLSSHSTHVAGTIMAAGINPLAKGMAYQANLDDYDWNNHIAEMALAAQNGLRISNHSYGLFMYDFIGNENLYYGLYLDTSQAFDDIAYNAPEYLIVKAAGNERFEPYIVYDCLFPDGSTSKNTLVIGAVNAIPGGYTGPTSVVMSSFSSWGPVDDGRIKPDVVADGVNLLSTYDGSDTDYQYSSGTSMASPSACGGMALLLQHYQNKLLRSPSSAMLKALAIHTAKESGPNPGPDYMFGWGLLSISDAVETVNKATVGSAVLYEGKVESKGIYTVDVNALGTEQLKATIVWTDPPGPLSPLELDPTQKELVNDLDLQISSSASGSTVTYLPWVLNRNNPSAAATHGINTVDNVEQVVVDTPSVGVYRITVYTDKNMVGGAQNFALVVTGCSPRLWKLTATTNAGAPIALTGTAPGVVGDSQNPYSKTIADGTMVELWAPETATTGLFFRRWVNAATGAVLSNSLRLRWVASSDLSLSVEYGTLPLGSCQLDIRSEPQGVTIGGSCPGVANYTAIASSRSLTTLRAPMVYSGDYVFSRWKSTSGVTLSDQSAYQLLVDTDRTVIAEYMQASSTMDSLTVQSEGASAVLIGGSLGGTTEYNEAVPDGSLVRLIAPYTSGLKYFQRWKDPSGNTLTVRPAYVFAMSGDITVIAEYGASPASKWALDWGYNIWGQVGNGTTDDVSSPIQPAGLDPCVEVACGLYHTLALTGDGFVFSWGCDRDGQTGLGASSNAVTAPDQVNITDVISIAAGARHSLAILSDGTVMAWGGNAAGQLGDGTTVSEDFPVQVEGLTDVVQVAGGEAHSLALTLDGTVWAWGSNVYGQLGDGTATSSSVPVQVNGLSSIVKVSAGSRHNLALKKDGTVWAWGDNTWGQLGIGNRVPQFQPVQVTSVANITDVAAGEAHSLAICSDTNIYAWGANWWGELGTGNLLSSNWPVLSIHHAGENPIAVAAGFYHSAKMMSDGTVQTFGWNRHGQLGDGTFTDKSSPVTHSPVTKAVCLATGGHHTAVIANGSGPAPAGPAKWTVMIYMAADNAGETRAISDFEELALTGSTADVKFVVLLDRAPGGDSSFGDWTGTRWGIVQKGDQPTASWGTNANEMNTGSAASLQSFVGWVKAAYPADNYALVLWDHSNIGIPTLPYNSAFGTDLTSGSIMTMNQLTGALDTLTSGGQDPFGLIVFDADLMNMVEVTYALRNYANFIVGSEERMQQYSLPYTAIADFLTQNKYSDEQTLGSEIVDQAYAYYTIMGIPNTTMSCIDTGEMDYLATQLNLFATYMINNWSVDAQGVGLLAQQVKIATQGAILNNMAGSAVPYANGLSIYLPLYARNANYNPTNVALASSTAWDEFIDAYLASMQGSYVSDAAESAGRFFDYEYANTDLIDFLDKLIANVGLLSTLNASSVTVSSVTPPASSSSTTEPPAAGAQPTAGVTKPVTAQPNEPDVSVSVPVAGDKLKEAVVDNLNASTTLSFARLSGAWKATDRLSGDFRNSCALEPASAAETARARFMCTTLPAGTYDVYVWWPNSKELSANAPFDVHYDGGVKTVRVNQTRNGERWNFIGSFTFTQGAHAVDVHNDAGGGLVAADAVRFVQVAK